MPSTRRRSTLGSTRARALGARASKVYRSTSKPCARRVRSAPSMTLAKNHLLIHGLISPMVLVRPDARLAADGEATYPSSAAKARTRARVAAFTFGRPRSARDTVAVETPAPMAPGIDDVARAAG